MSVRPETKRIWKGRARVRILACEKENMKTHIAKGKKCAVKEKHNTQEHEQGSE